MLKSGIALLLPAALLLSGCLVTEGDVVGTKDGKSVYQSTCSGPVGGTPTLGGKVLAKDFSCTNEAEKTCPAGYQVTARDESLPQYEVRKNGTPTGYTVQSGYFQSVKIQYVCK